MSKCTACDGAGDVEGIECPMCFGEGGICRNCGSPMSRVCEPCADDIAESIVAEMDSDSEGEAE